MLDVLVAGKARVVHILDRVVAVWSSDSLELTLVGSVDGHLLEYRVRRREGREAQECGCDFHCGSRW